MTDLVSELRALTGDAGLVDPTEMPDALIGYRGVHRGDAIAIVRPSTTAETAEVVRMCAAHGAAIVTQGGNTGLSGGSVPTADPAGPPSVLLSTSRLRLMEPISPGATSVTVGAGVTIEAVQIAASGAGMCFAPDWGARGTATVGGAVSTNAGGINVLAHGTFRNHVLGLEVVLPDGRIWNGLRALRKDSSGYDMKQLFIGAEGTLGVVTRATLSLAPALAHEASALAAISSTSDLPALVSMAMAGTNATLTALELIPRMGMAAVCQKFDRSPPLTTSSEWYLLIRYSGSSPVDHDLAGFLRDASDRGLVLDAVVAATRHQSDALWFIREELPPPGLMANSSRAVKMDSVVPVERISDYIDAINAVCRSAAPAATPYIFGHVGDGNLHVHVLAPDDGPEAVEFDAIRPELHRRLDQLTWSMGGSISAEHGIGQELLDRIIDQKPPVEFELMRAVKAAIDPLGIMNPGKTIPDSPAT